MVRALALAVFLIYLWCWTAPSRNPGQPPPEPTGSFRHRFVSDGSVVRYEVGGRVEWTLPSPGDSFVFRKGRFHERDVCHGRNDGDRVLARGRELYDYLRSHNLSTTRRLRLFAGSTTHQTDDVFYFTCRDQTVERLDMCPTGRVFRDGECKGIDGCLGAAAGTSIPDPIYLSRYYLCPGGDAPAVLKSCRDETWFLYDACRPVSDFDEFCNAGNEVIRLLDDATRIECRDGKASFRTCPEGEKFFGERCESTACASEPEGTLLPLPAVSNGPFRYSPGYEACRNGRVVGSHECPSTWDDARAGDRLTHLPLVFDGRECSVPEFCTNVQPEDPGIVVPRYDFSKHVRNWRHSEAADGVVGTVCEGRVRKRKYAEPGFVVSKRYRQEASPKTFLPDRFDGYFENGNLVPCGRGEIFDGASCRPRVEKAFSHKGLGIFRLAAGDWFPAWDYERSRIVECDDPKEVLLETWNACAPPNCTRFPWLSKVNFTIRAEDGVDCTGIDGRIVESERDEECDFWTQGAPGECVPGNRISSGNFAHDSTLYATCDPSQPFVFCPYADTEGIELVEGKRWCCVPKHRERQLLEPGSVFVFEKNELLMLTPLEGTAVVDVNNSLDERVPPQGFVARPNEKIRVRTKADAVVAHFRYRNTFPPDVVYEMGEPRLSNLDKGGAFLMKLRSFTTKPLALPSFHGLVDSVADFDA